MLESSRFRSEGPPLVSSKAEDYYRRERPDLLALVPPHARRILDVGCGEGALGARLAAALGAEVHGIERHAPAAAAARRVLASVIEGDAATATIPFPEGAFDCLVYGDVLEHMADPWTLLRSHVRFLRRGGTVVASVPNVRHLSVVLPLLFAGRFEYEDEGILDRTHLRFFTRRSFVDLLAGAGLEDVRLRRECGLAFVQGAFARVLGAVPLLRDWIAVRYAATARKPQ